MIDFFRDTWPFSVPLLLALIVAVLWPFIRPRKRISLEGIYDAGAGRYWIVTEKRDSDSRNEGR